MEITAVNVKLMPRRSDKLVGFCTIVFDDEFIIRDVKIIQGGNGIFIGMPSRKMADGCPKCRVKNHLRASYCNGCGGKLDPERGVPGPDGRLKLNVDVSHPIKSECRDRIQAAVAEAVEAARREADASRDDIGNREPAVACAGDGGSDDGNDTSDDDEGSDNFGTGIFT